MIVCADHLPVECKGDIGRCQRARRARHIVCQDVENIHRCAFEANGDIRWLGVALSDCYVVPSTIKGHGGVQLNGACATSGALIPYDGRWGRIFGLDTCYGVSDLVIDCIVHGGF